MAQYAYQNRVYCHDCAEELWGTCVHGNELREISSRMMDEQYYPQPTEKSGFCGRCWGKVGNPPTYAITLSAFKIEPFTVLYQVPYDRALDECLEAIRGVLQQLRFSATACSNEYLMLASALEAVERALDENSIEKQEVVINAIFSEAQLFEYCGFQGMFSVVKEN